MQKSIKKFGIVGGNGVVYFGGDQVVGDLIQNLDWCVYDLYCLEIVYE